MKDEFLTVVCVFLTLAFLCLDFGVGRFVLLQIILFLEQGNFLNAFGYFFLFLVLFFYFVTVILLAYKSLKKGL